MEPISFARGVPSPDCLPVDELADCALAAISSDGKTVLSYGAAGGYAPLRKWIAERHGVEPDRVVLTNGSLQGFVFLAGQLAPQGPVLVEAPTYDRPLKILAGLETEILSVDQDSDGLDLGALESALDAGRKPRFLYTIPPFQNPSGRTVPPDRRRRLVELARAHELLILEDDPYVLVRFEGDAPPTLFELAGGEGVIYSSSFSKTVAPGLRTGYLVLPSDLASQVEAAAAAAYITPALIAQATVFEFLRRGNLAANLERVCDLLRARRDPMMGALQRELPEASWSRPEGGYFLWLDLPPGVLTAELATEGVTFVPGSDFFAGAGGESAVRLAF